MHQEASTEATGVFSEDVYLVNVMSFDMNFKLNRNENQL